MVTKIYKREQMLLLPKHQKFLQDTSNRLKKENAKWSKSHLVRFILDAVGDMTKKDFEKMLSKYT